LIASFGRGKGSRELLIGSVLDEVMQFGPVGRDEKRFLVEMKRRE